MAVRGRHRRYQPNRINRASLTVTAGGAGLAIPLIGATAAHAADADTWSKVAACESSGRWDVNTGNGHYSGLQFTQSTWEAYGGRSYAHRADQASRAQQIAVAERVLNGQGPGAWRTCAQRAGLSRGTPAQAAPAAAYTGSRTAAPKAGTGTRQVGEAVADVKPETTPQSRAGTAEMYTVVRGDTLSEIAEDHRVPGGWQGLYSANRSTVGADPDLIIPGQRLGLDGSPATTAPHRTAARPAPKSPAGTERHTRPAHPAPERHAPEHHAPDQGRVSAPVPSRASKATKAPKATKTPRPSERATRPSRPAQGATKPAGAQAKPAAGHHSSSARPAHHGLLAPVAASIGTPYHSHGSSWSKGYHTGVDFLVPTGTSVKAVAAGHVVSAGWGGSYGYQVVVRHADGKYSQYAHLSAISVKAGQSVVAGQRLGRSGATGNVTGPHLHFEVRTGPGFGSDIDPLAYLRAGGVRI